MSQLCDEEEVKMSKNIRQVKPRLLCGIEKWELCFDGALCTDPRSAASDG